MRVNGDKKITTLKSVMIESLFLCVVGFYFLVRFLGRVGLSMLSNSAEEDFKMSFQSMNFLGKEGTLFFTSIFVFFIGVIPETSTI